MADTRTEQPADQDAGLQGVLALYAPLLAGLRQAAPVDRQVSALVDEAVEVWSRPGFDTFLSGVAAVQPVRLPAAAAPTVLRRMRGRAILADEVGSRQDDRGRADPRPSCGCAGWPTVRWWSLRPGWWTQWREELERKFAAADHDRRPRHGGRDGERRPSGGGGVAGRGPARSAASSRLTARAVGRGDRRRGAPACATRAAPPGSWPARCAPGTCCC